MNKDSIMKIMVIAALIGYIFCSIYIFYSAITIIEDGKLPEKYEINKALIYFGSGLAGLVGGIVAMAFGISTPANSKILGITSRRFKLQNLGSFVSSSSKEDEKERFGNWYGYSYIIVGFTSIVLFIWLNENAIDSLSNMATTFFGMLIPIVSQYFKPE